MVSDAALFTTQNPTLAVHGLLLSRVVDGTDLTITVQGPRQN
jgi:hypothetical protein